MATRTLEQVMKELEPSYSGSRDIIQKRVAALPGQAASQTQALEARQKQAFDNILSGARRRGTGIAFGGIPLSEQAEYTATEFLPAVARLEGQQQESQLTLEEALQELGREQRTQAIGIRESELQRELERRRLQEEARQFNEQQRLAREDLAQRLRIAEMDAAATRSAAQASSNASRYLPAPVNRPSAPQAVRATDLARQGVWVAGLAPRFQPR